MDIFSPLSIIHIHLTWPKWKCYLCSQRDSNLIIASGPLADVSAVHVDHHPDPPHPHHDHCLLGYLQEAPQSVQFKAEY